MAGSSHKRQATSDPDGTSTYVSPLKRVERAFKQASKKRVIESADALKAFIGENDMNDSSVAASIMLRLRVVWTSFEVGQTGPVARLHLVDVQAKDSIEDMHKGFRDDYKEKKRHVDAELVTASIYGVDENTNGIPPDGAIICVRNMWKLRLFADRACQLTTNMDAIKVEK